jgi:hypothetical protein
MVTVARMIQAAPITTQKMRNACIAGEPYRRSRVLLVELGAGKARREGSARNPDRLER